MPVHHSSATASRVCCAPAVHLRDINVSLAKFHCPTSIARKADDGIESVDSFARLKAEFGSAALSCEEHYFSNAPPARVPRSQQQQPHSPRLAPTVVTSPKDEYHGARTASPKLLGGGDDVGGGGGGGGGGGSAALGRQLGAFETRLGALEALAQREHATLRADVVRLTAELQHERAAAQAAEGRLAAACLHAADLRGLAVALAACATVALLVGRLKL